MVEEIDEILQDLIDHSDQQHSVKLSHDFHDGIVVWVDGARHLGVENVPEPEIQRLIRAAVAEWERRSERAR